MAAIIAPELAATGRLSIAAFQTLESGRIRQAAVGAMVATGLGSAVATNSAVRLGAAVRLGSAAGERVAVGPHETTSSAARAPIAAGGSAGMGIRVGRTARS